MSWIKECWARKSFHLVKHCGSFTFTAKFGRSMALAGNRFVACTISHTPMVLTDAVFFRFVWNCCSFGFSTKCLGVRGVRWLGNAGLGNINYQQTFLKSRVFTGIPCHADWKRISFKNSSLPTLDFKTSLSVNILRRNLRLFCASCGPIQPSASWSMPGGLLPPTHFSVLVLSADLWSTSLHWLHFRGSHFSLHDFTA